MLKLEEFCYRSASKTSIKFGIAGLGQAGGKIADLFASLRNVKYDNKAYYDVVAINSFWGDLEPLKNILKERKLQLIGGEGCGRKPEFCYELMKNPENQRLVLYFLKKHLSDCDMIIFVAGLGGGTGTGLLAATVQVANQVINKPLVSQGKRPVPIGVIITLPRKTDPVIEKRNTVKALEELKELINKGIIRFCILIDNEKAFMDYKELKSRLEVPFKNWMDYANHVVVSFLHEFNMGISNYSDKNFDPRDMKNIFEDNPGCLVLSKLAASAEEIHRPEAVIKKITDCIQGRDTNVLANGYEIKDATHAGFLLVKPKESDISRDIMDEIDLKLHELMPFTITRPGSCINWNQEKDRKFIVYTVAKITGFPERARKGIQDELVESTNSISDRIKNKKINTELAAFNDDIFFSPAQQEDIYGGDPFASLDESIWANNPQKLKNKEETTVEDIFNNPDVLNTIYRNVTNSNGM